MKWIVALLASGLCLPQAAAAPRDALGHMRDAIDVVNDEGGRCKREMLEDMREAEDLLRDKQYKRAHRLIVALEKDSGVCRGRVGKLLRRALDAIQGSDDGDGGDRGDRGDRDRRDRDRADRDRRDAEAKPPERPKGVPFADWGADCKALWMIVEIARYNTDKATEDALIGLSSGACGGKDLPATNWPNGQTAKTSGGTFYYPNGQTALTSGGTYYYPNGQTAKTNGGTWYYPNGQTAQSSGGTWYYANGAQAGGWELLAADACTRAGDAACNKYKWAMKSDLADWRTFAVVQLVATASRSGR